MKVTETPLPGVRLLEPVVHTDDRGYFYESFHRERFIAAGIDVSFVQTNVSHSRRGVLRGLHYQWPHAQGKLVSVLEGEVFDVAVDIRPDSPTFRRSFACMLSEQNKRQMWIPEGYAHGFCVVSDHATFMYQCTALYDRSSDAAIRWDDASLSVDWPLTEPSVSPKDASAPFLDAVPIDRLPRWTA